MNVDALRNGTVVLLHARGLFEDGLAFDMPERAMRFRNPRNIVNAFSPTADHLTIQLAIRHVGCLTAKIANWVLPLKSDTRAMSGESHELNDENTGRYRKAGSTGTQEYSPDGRKCGRRGR